MTTKIEEIIADALDCDSAIPGVRKAKAQIVLTALDAAGLALLNKEEVQAACLQCADKGREMGLHKADSVIPENGRAMSLHEWVKSETEIWLSAKTAKG